MARVLVVDDNRFVLWAVCRLLSVLDHYEVFSTSSPRRALEIISESRIDVVLSDIAMPEMSGPELLQEITTISPSTACLLMSAYPTEEFDLPPGIPFLQKPFSDDELASAIAKVLSQQLPI